MIFLVELIKELKNLNSNAHTVIKSTQLIKNFQVMFMNTRQEVHWPVVKFVEKL